MQPEVAQSRKVISDIVLIACKFFQAWQAESIEYMRARPMATCLWNAVQNISCIVEIVDYKICPYEK
jgi:hypothetical protein